MPEAGELLKTVFLGRKNGTRARVRRTLRRWLDGRGGNGQQDGGDDGRNAGRASPALPPVPDGFTAVLQASEVGEGGLIEVMVAEEPVAVCRIGGEIFAVSGVCPHAGGPIGDGTLDGHTVTCPYHGWSYDVRSGACLVDDTVRIDTRAVRVVGQRVCIGPVQE